MDAGIYGCRITGPSPDQWTDEAPDHHFEELRHTRRHAPDITFEEIDLTPREALIDCAHSSQSASDLNLGLEDSFDHRPPASTNDTEHLKVQHKNVHNDGDDDICQSCISSLWERIPVWESARLIDMNRTQLAASHCRICRLFARIMEVQRLPEDEQYVLQWFSPGSATFNSFVSCTPYAAEDEKIDLLQIRPADQSKEEGWGTLPKRERRAAPHLLITNFPLQDNLVRARYHQASQINVDQVRNWMKECYVNHRECRIGDVHRPPRELRVIDCGSKIVVPAPVGCQYVALSYVWGQHNDCFHDLQEPPRTIADSIYITQMLGYQYLWIDRFCIDQNDRIDKHRQVKQMGDIYAAAQITLVAAAGNDPSYGLPGVLSRLRPVPEAEKAETIWLKPLPRLVQLVEVAESKWASRAWTFQEFYRSRRRLIFSENQMIFVCNRQIRYEIALSGINWPGSDGLSTEDDYWTRRWLPNDRVAKYQKWHWTAVDVAAGHLQAYSNRDLTYDSDSLNAIAGALDPLRNDAVYHVWGALFRHAGDALLARLRQRTRDVCSSPVNGILTSSGSRQTSDEDRSRFKPAPLPALQDLQELDNPFGYSRLDHHPISRHSHQIEMALAWYHQKRGRRRPGFPSWSSLGWEGPISWYRWISESEDSPVVLSHVRSARVHFPGFSCDLSDYNSALPEEIEIIPPMLEITVRTTQLDLVLDGNKSQVALDLNANYKYVFRLDWDLDPASLDGKRLVGALIEGRVRAKLEAFVLVLAPHGDVLERVGLVHLPRSRYLLRVDGMRRQDLMPLIEYCEREAADTLLKSYSWENGTWWQDIFSDYHPILIG